MQLQIYIIFDKLWHKMSFEQRLKSSYTMTRFEFSWKMIPESRSRDRKRKGQYRHDQQGMESECLY